MLYTFIALSFLASVAVSLVLRYLDRAETQRVRRQGDLQNLQLQKIAEERIRAIDDATIDFEMKVRQARSAREEMISLIDENRQQLDALREEGRVVERVQGEIRRIADEAGEVNRQVHLLEAGLDRVNKTRTIVENLEKRTADLTENLHLRGEEVRERLEEVLNHIIEEARSKTRDFVEKENTALRELHGRQETISRGLEEEMHQVDVLHERVGSLQDQLEERVALEGVRVEERFTDLERRFQERIGGMEGGLAQIRETAVKSLKEEITRIRTDLDNFSLETIANRDEIINDTRRMATGLLDQIEGFQGKVVSAENKLTRLVEDGRNALNDRFEELVTGRADDLRSRIETDYEKLIVGVAQAGEKLRDGLTRHMADLQAAMSEKVGEEHGDLLKMRESFLRIKDELEDRVDSLEGQLRDVGRARQRVEEAAHRAQSDMTMLQEGLVEELERRGSRFMEEQDEKLSKLNSTIDEKVSRQVTALVDRGQIHIDELERRTAETVHRAVEHMEQDLARARDDFARIRSEVQNEAEKSRDQRDQVLREIQEDSSRIRRFEEKLALVDTAENLAIRLDEAVQTLSRKLEEAREDRRRMEDFFGRVEGLRDIRENLEKEVGYLTERKILLDGAEERFHSLSGQIQDLEARFATVEGADHVLERIEERMLKFEEYRRAFEAFFKDLADRRKYFETTLQAVEKSKKEAQDAATAARSSMGEMERIDIRKDSARKEIEDLEKRVAGLQHMDREFQRVEARFEQMETLLTDLEQKQDQIATMSKKIGEIARQSDFMRQELASLVSEAGEKMDRLSAFYETVDHMISEADHHTKEPETVRGSAQPAKGSSKKAGGLEEWKKEGILSLYVNHKWEPELIAERMRLEVSVVRAVIASYRQAHPV